MTMDGKLAFGIRLFLLALTGAGASGGLATIFAYDPMTDTITIPVEGLASTLTAFGVSAASFLSWAGLHRVAKARYGVT